MKTRFLHIFLFLTISFGCKTENKYENDAELCELLSKMLEDDQEIRNLPELADPFFPILDSIIADNFSSRKEYAELPTEEQLRWGKIARKITDKLPKPSQHKVDSLWVIQKGIDKQNTKLLLDIIGKRGWVNKEALGCTQYVSPMIIFRHSPEEFWDEMRPIVEKEYSEKRMDDGEYWFIKDHLDGRPGVVIGDSIQNN